MVSPASVDPGAGAVNCTVGLLVPGATLAILTPPGPSTTTDWVPASGTSVATVDTALRDADAGWQHGAPVVGGMTTASDGTILLAGSLHARVLAFAPDGTLAYLAVRDGTVFRATHAPVRE